MNSAQELSKATLLEIEGICDRYERDLRENCALSHSAYLATLKETPRRRAAHELAAIDREYTETLPQTEPPETIQLPRTDRFDYRERLGAGGCGSVWKAWDRELAREVAIKLSHQNSDAALKRFDIEARVVARLRHPNIVRIYEVLRCEGDVALVCEYIKGKTLSKHVAESPLEPKVAVDLMIQLADACAAAHSAGVVHRDIKPQNILLDQDGRPHLTDFGLAWDSVATADRITLTGEIIGTPAFMAPEQTLDDGAEGDTRSDVYSLGAVLFFALTGDVPFRGSIANTIHQVVYAAPPSPRHERVDPA